MEFEKLDSIHESLQEKSDKIESMIEAQEEAITEAEEGLRKDLERVEGNDSSGMSTWMTIVIVIVFVAGIAIFLRKQKSKQS